jgi:hypothetical protein
VLDRVLNEIVRAMQQNSQVLRLTGGPATFIAAAKFVVNSKLGTLARDEDRKSWIEALVKAAKKQCGCAEIRNLRDGIRADRDMQALERLVRCLAEQAEARANSGVNPEVFPVDQFGALHAGGNASQL